MSFPTRWLSTDSAQTTLFDYKLICLVPVHPMRFLETSVSYTLPNMRSVVVLLAIGRRGFFSFFRCAVASLRVSTLLRILRIFRSTALAIFSVIFTSSLDLFLCL